MTKSDTIFGLPAHVRADCVVLVLGSMPGVASLAQAQYYAHPRNRFWPLMEQLLGLDAGAAHAQRMQALADARVGLWDVIGQCSRRGSLDADIVRGSEVANPLPELIATLPQLRLVACNGAAAFQAFQRFIAPQLPAPVSAVPMPSTSPANASFNLLRLRQAWQPVAETLALQR